MRTAFWQMWTARPRLASILQDARFGLRLFRKNGTISAAAVLSLSLAIGACMAAFSLIDALILRPLPVSNPEQLVYLAYRLPEDPNDSETFNYPLFERLRDASRPHLQLFGVSYQSRRDAIFDDVHGQTEKIYAQWISGDAFRILGVKASLGRMLTASDDVKPGQHPVAVISDEFWSRRFGRSPDVLGRWVKARDKQLQIVGVAERKFTGVEPGIMTDLWAPAMMWDDRAIAEPGWGWFRAWGRLEPGASAGQARAILQTVSVDFRRERAATRRADVPGDQIERYVNAPVYLRAASNGPSVLRQNFGRALWMLGLIAAMVLLIACLNVASLLVARTVARDREMALRVSIGAARGRLIQQVLVESSLLSIASCVAGGLIGVYSAPLVASLLSTSVSVIRFDLRFDWRLLAFVATIGTTVTCLFGLGPAFRASAVSPNDTLKAGSGKQSARIGMFRPLVVAQAAFSFLVLFVGGLFLTSFLNLTRTDLGFDQNNLFIASVEAQALRDSGADGLAVWRQLIERLNENPQIQSAGLSAWGLMEGSTSSRSLRIPGRPVEAYEPFYLPVSPGFLDTLRMRLLEGRDFEWRDVRPGGDARVIVNESFARRYFPGESALGKRFFQVGGKNALLAQEVIGVVRDAKYSSVREAAPPTVYLPQWSPGWGALQIRSSLDYAAVAALLREELPRAHPAFRVVDMTLQSTLVNNVLVRERVLAVLSAFFAIVAIILVAVGLYGVLSYSVVARTREIGIRLALGARPFGVMQLVVKEILLVLAIGIALGVAGGITASRFTAALLYGVKPSDLWSLGLPLVCLLITCAIAASLPALRATRVDPMTALRSD
jgi:putative ABC transport system permease protein